MSSETPERLPAGTSRNLSTPSQPSPLSRTSSTPRQSPRSRADKLNIVLDSLDSVGWSLPRFLEEFFKIQEKKGTELVKVKRDERHERVLTSMINGTTKPHFGTLLELVYRNACAVKFLSKDATIQPGRALFSQDLTPNDIPHALPAITTWSVRLTGFLVNEEASEMVKPDAGLHLRVQAKAGGASEQHKVTWNAIREFSMKRLERIAERNAPVMTFLVNVYTTPDFLTKESDEQISRSAYRPQNLNVIDSIMSMTFTRSSRANLYAMCRGIWLFATKASNTIFRVASRVGDAVSYTSINNALREMSKAKRTLLKSNVAAGKHYIVVSDNVQTYVKPKDRRIGKVNKMISGLAATAVEMQDYLPEAFNLRALLERQALQERRQLTTHLILSDLDLKHIENVAVAEFLHALINFVPQLSTYQQDLHTHKKSTISKNPIRGNRKSNIIPLATNSSNEMLLQEMRSGILDFASTQMGITAENLNDTLSIWSGDGKTFNMFLLMKKILASEPDDFNSFRWLVPLLELWHTKWTDLSRVVRTHWGSIGDPSSLAMVAQLAECPTPSDMRKVDFYDGSHLVNLALDAHLLNCWDYARYPHGGNPQKAPQGRPWVPTVTQPVNPPPTTTTDNDEIEPLPIPAGVNTGDITLANSVLFIRNAIWWREVCRAIAEGDTGRVWEVMKHWLFTFTGSGNPYYSQFLLELYCNFKWEFPPELKDAIFQNWLVNPHGQPGRFIEMDLMQEHFNFWLEDLAQHKGKEFDEPFYREVLSMNVDDFLKLKDEMEDAASLKQRTKKHGTTDLGNELRAVMDKFRDEQVNCYRAGRNEGVGAPDDFANGMRTLEATKIRDFISKSTIFSTVLRMHNNDEVPATLPTVIDAEEEITEMGQSVELYAEGAHVPHHSMAVIDGEICMEDPGVPDWDASPLE
ncbi:hypothetical protein NLJ89_g1460 [Agrocybe chaxingu]|uniref:DUF6589 domain-containing protein n=1 Tax=Agrocybe chaxingu TaxID=84603 RepID=A0A9W8N005_9AGAR|nr:hypothetical protein NLJ89_g1460 [Agrocybe chaxingu]